MFNLFIHFTEKYQTTKLLHICITEFRHLVSSIKSIAKSIYLKLPINIPQPRVLGPVFLSFSLKLIESHKRIRSVMNFS